MIKFIFYFYGKIFRVRNDNFRHYEQYGLYKEKNPRNISLIDYCQWFLDHINFKIWKYLYDRYSKKSKVKRIEITCNKITNTISYSSNGIAEDTDKKLIKNITLDPSIMDSMSLAIILEFHPLKDKIFKVSFFNPHIYRFNSGEIDFISATPYQWQEIYEYCLERDLEYLIESERDFTYRSLKGEIG